jgi:PhnB protein
MTRKKQPDRYNNAIIAHIMLSDAKQAISFYEKAFNAKELYRIAKPDGKIIHSEILIENSIIMVGDSAEPFSNPQELNGTTVGLHIYVNSVDDLFEQAISSGAIVIQPVTDMFYGDRVGMLKDPFGHIWVLLTHQIEMTPEQIKEKGEALLQSLN